MKRYFIIVASVIFSLNLNAQKTITGRVTQIGGGIIPAVKVYAKEAPSIFTFTSEKGNYKITIPNEVTSLIFSYSGMHNKTVKIREFPIVNVKLIPSKYKRFRYGFGLSLGTSKFSLQDDPDIPTAFDTVIQLTPISIHADLFLRLNKSFDIQTIIEDGINFSKIDSVTETGEVIQTNETIMLNRFSVSLLVNYNIAFSKTGSHSAFIGMGPQFQQFSFIKTNTIGARFQAGVNLNNHGLTSRIFLAIDVSNGKFSENNKYVPGFPYNYLSSRLGAVFIF